MHFGKQLKSLVAFHIKPLYIKLPKRPTKTWLIVHKQPLPLEKWDILKGETLTSYYIFFRKVWVKEFPRYKL